MKFKPFSALTVLLLAGCAETAVTPIARNQIMLSTSAAPACGRTGAVKVANKMAAVETLRRGYQRFIIAGANSANNTRAISTGPTYAYTSGSYSGYGNSVYGNSTTTFGGNNVMWTGSNDADLLVIMLNPGERGYNDGIDAKSQLGAEWEQLVKDGISTC